MKSVGCPSGRYFQWHQDFWSSADFRPIALDSILMRMGPRFLVYKWRRLHPWDLIAAFFTTIFTLSLSLSSLYSYPSSHDQLVILCFIFSFHSIYTLFLHLVWFHTFIWYASVNSRIYQRPIVPLPHLQCYRRGKLISLKLDYIHWST